MCQCGDGISTLCERITGNGIGYGSIDLIDEYISGSSALSLSIGGSSEMGDVGITGRREVYG